MIFDMVIEEGIIRFGDCDHITFPYIHTFLSSGASSYHFYGSYHRLRLVCRRFNALLGTRPHCNLHMSSFPFPMNIRTLQGRESDRVQISTKNAREHHGY
jgi:hypothetical protein